MHQSTLRYKKARWLKIASALLLIIIPLYALHDPQPVANGGTWLGYLLGTLGAALIAWLAWFGIRKRDYRSTNGTLQGWLSAHIYLGLALLVVGTLHTGFQFAWNLHTLAYVLMCIVIVSGIVGITFYVKYPRQLSDNRRNRSQAGLLLELEEADRETVAASSGLSAELQAAIDSSIELTALGGNAWRQLNAHDYSELLVNGQPQANPDQRKLVERLANLLGDEDPKLNAQIRKVIEAVNRRSQLLKTLRKDIRIRALLDVWLMIHIPATVALLAALFTHIFVVFYYW